MNDAMKRARAAVLDAKIKQLQESIKLQQQKLKELKAERESLK